MATTVSARTLQGLIDSGDITPQQIADKVRSGEIAVLDDTIAGKARQRLAAQGLTLDQVKANGVPTQEAPSVADEMMSTAGDQARGAVRGIGGMIGGMADASLNAVMPVRAAMNAPDQIRGMLGDQQNRMAATEDRYADSPVKRTIDQTLNALSPVGGGMVSDLLRPTMNSTEGRQTTPEEFAAGGGAGAQLGAMAASGPVAKAIAGTGAGIAEGAQGQWNRAVSTPATAPLVESMGPKLMDAIGVVNDPAAISAKAGEMRASIPKPKGTLGQPLAPDQAALLNDRAFQSNIQTVADSLAETNPQKVGNVLMEGLEKATKRGVGTYIVEKMLDAATGGAASKVVAGMQIAKTALLDLPKTVAFKTASAVAKKSFGEALAKGDLLTASELGARIASGMMAEDAFGHRKAVQALSQETAQYPSPDLKRQVVAAKKWVYVDPKSGADIALPPNVGTAFANSPHLTETQSPVQVYVDAMIKQGKLPKGGKVEFR